MVNKKITQNNISAGGDVIAGDYIVEHHSRRSLLEPIRHLLPKLKEEMYSEDKCTHYVDEFAHYYFYENDNPLRTVEDKLKDGGRIDELQYALECKEYFNKQLQRFMFYETAQRVYALILDSVEEYYRGEVYPLIKDGKTRTVIDSAISERLVDKIYSQIDSIDILITKKSIRGMLYFLTQKCVIDWA